MPGSSLSKASGLAAGAGRPSDVIEGQSSVHVGGGDIQRLIEERLREVRISAAEEGRRRGRADAIRRFEAILDTGRPVDERLDPQALSTGYGGEWGVAELLLPRPAKREILEEDLGYRQRIGVVSRLTPGQFQQAAGRLGIARTYTVWEIDAAAEWATEGASQASADTGWSLFFHTDARAQSPWARLAVNHPQSWYPPEGIPGNPDLPAIFKQAFLEEYAIWSDAYYSRHFHRGLDAGSDLGYTVGYHLSRQSTYYQAQAEELDRVWAERSRTAYEAAYVDGVEAQGGRTGGYRAGFLESMATYKTQAVVRLEITGIESLAPIDDGIISPGERVALVFDLTNLGLVAASWQGTVAGAIDGGAQAVSGEIGASSRRSYRSATVPIAGDLLPRQVASLSLEVRVAPEGQPEPQPLPGRNTATGERLAGSWNQPIHNVVEIAGIDVELELVSGSGTLSARATNTSRLETSSGVAAILTADGGMAERVELGTLAPGATTTANFQITGQDPLDLIGRQKPLALELYLGPTLMEIATVSIGEPDRVQGLADYFDALHGGPIPAFVPPDTDRGQRREAVIERILEVARAEIAEFSQRRANNIWKTRNGAAEYMVGALAARRLAGNRDSSGDAGYRDLGQRLLKLAPTVEGSGKRRAFKKRGYEIERNRRR